MASGRRDVDDYSFSRPAMSALARGLMRYLYNNGKGLTAPEVAVISSAGKILGLNYEAGAGDFTGGSTGRDHAVAAAQLAARLPIRKAPVICSADWPVTVAQMRGVGDAVETAMSVLGPGWIGCYGHAGLIDYLWSRFGSACFYWQTYAWSGGRLSAHADLYQFLNGQNVTGGQVDYNQIVGRNFLTALGGVTPTPPPAPRPRNPEDVVFEKLKPGESVCISMKDKTGDITFTTTDGGAQINAGIDGGAALITKDIWLDATNQQEYGVTKVRGAFLTVYHHGIPGDAKTGGTLGIDVRYAPQQ